MPLATKSDKFFLIGPSKKFANGVYMLLGTNRKFKGGPDTINLQDMLDFLEKKNIDPKRVPMNDFLGFIPVK